MIAIDPVEFKREQAMEFGATHTYSSLEDAMAEVPDLTWGDMCDRVILSPGVVHGDMIEPALGLDRQGWHARGDRAGTDAGTGRGRSTSSCSP